MSGDKLYHASQSRINSEVVIYAIFFCIISSSLLLVNKFALTHYAYPNAVLLLQLASSALLARLSGALGWSQVDKLEMSKVVASIPLTASFYLALFTGMNTLNHINVDTFILMKTCTPITVAIYEYLFASYVMPSSRTWVSLAMVAVFTAASFSTQVQAINLAGACWLAIWFLSLTFYMIYAVHYVTAVHLTVMGRMYYENLLSCVPAVVMVMCSELQPGLVTRMWGWGGASVLLSCLMGFVMSGISWTLRKSISALSHTVLGVTNKLLAVVINSVVWDKHGPIVSQVLLVCGILSSTLYQQPVKSKQAKRLSGFRLLLATAAAASSVILLTWFGVGVGNVLIEAGGGSGGVRIHLGDIQPAIIHQIMSGERAAARVIRQIWHQTTHLTELGVGASAMVHKYRSRSHDGSAVLPAPVQERDEAYFAKLRAAASKPFTINVVTSVFWSMPRGSIGNCSLDGVPLDCQIGGDERTADVLYFHVPSGGPLPGQKQFPNQLRLAMSLESGAYYPALDDPRYMCHFDAEMSFRTCAQVTNYYSVESFKFIFEEPIPFEQKKHAIVYVNSNCGTLSGRREIMAEMIQMGPDAKMPVHSFGRCDNNMPWPGTKSKREVFREYKFCVAMENSVRYDYLTEKIWDALIAGCVPVYMGTPDVYRFMPHPNAVIMYGPGGNATTPQELHDLMHAIGSDKKRYEAMLAWKKQPVSELGPLFQHLYSIRNLSGECLLCQFMARHRMDPQPRYTTCLFNETWMAGANMERHTVKQETC